MPAVPASDFQDYEAMTLAVHGAFIPYSTMFARGPRVEFTNCYRDDTLPVASCKLTVRDAVLVVTLEQWRGRTDELKAYVRKWVAEQVNLQGLKTLPRRRRDPEWMRLWREANPGRRV